MKKTIFTEKGIIFNGGKVVDWDTFYECVYRLSDMKVVEKLQKNQKDVIKFEIVERSQKSNFHDEARILGTKSPSKKAVDNKIRKLNS